MSDMALVANVEEMKGTFFVSRGNALKGCRNQQKDKIYHKCKPHEHFTNIMCTCLYFHYKYIKLVLLFE